MNWSLKLTRFSSFGVAQPVPITSAKYMSPSLRRSVRNIEFVDDRHDDGVDRLILRLGGLPGGTSAAYKHHIACSGLHGVDRDDERIFQLIIQPNVFDDLEF